MNQIDMAVMRVAVRNLIQDRSFQACRCDGDDLIRHSQITDIDLFEYQGNPDRTAAVVYFNGSSVVNSEIHAVVEQLRQDATQRFEIACCAPNGQYVLRQVQVEAYSYSTASSDLAAAGGDDEEGMSEGTIVGIVIGVLLLVGLSAFLVAVFAFGWKRDKVGDKWVQLKDCVAGKRAKNASGSSGIVPNPNFTMTPTTHRVSRPPHQHHHTHTALLLPAAPRHHIDHRAPVLSQLAPFLTHICAVRGLGAPGPNVTTDTQPKWRLDQHRWWRGAPQGEEVI